MHSNANSSDDDRITFPLKGLLWSHCTMPQCQAFWKQNTTHGKIVNRLSICSYKVLLWLSSHLTLPLWTQEPIRLQWYLSSLLLLAKCLASFHIFHPNSDLSFQLLHLFITLNQAFLIFPGHCCMIRDVNITSSSKNMPRHIRETVTHCHLQKGVL